MRITKTQEYQNVGRKIEGDGSIAVRAITTGIDINLNPREAKAIVADLEKLSKVSDKTELFLAKLRATCAQPGARESQE